MEIQVYAFIGKKRNSYDTAEYISGSQFADAIAAAQDTTDENIVVRVNSGGGSVTDGALMYNAIKASKKPVHVIIDGFAASMGVYGFLSAGKITAAKNSMLMYHSVQGGATGSPEDLRAEADVLDKFNQTIAGTLADRTGLTVEEVTAKYLGKEVWLTAQEALDAKLIDGIEEYNAENVPDVSASTTFEEATARFAAMHTTEKLETVNGLVAKIKAAVKEALSVAPKQAALVNSLDAYAKSFYDDQVWAQQVLVNAAKYAIANCPNPTVVAEAKKTLNDSLKNMTDIIAKVYGESADVAATVAQIGEARFAAQAKDIETKISGDITALTTAKDAEIKTLKAKVATLEAKSSAAPSGVGKNNDDVSSSSKETGTRAISDIEAKRDAIIKANEEFDITKTRLED